MAYSHISKPGSEFGPCADDCEHTDCAQSRKWASTPCRICGRPIGYETRFQGGYHDEVLVHFACACDEAEKGTE